MTGQPSKSLFPPGYTARPYRDTDRDACLELFDSNVPGYFHEEEREEYRGWLANPGGPVLVVAGPDGSVAAAGGVALEPDGETGSLCWGTVRADLHGRGLGRALLLARLALLAGDPACRRVRLSTIASTAGFFEQAGFTTESVEADGHGPGLDAYEMTAELTPALRTRFGGQPVGPLPPEGGASPHPQ